MVIPSFLPTVLTKTARLSQRAVSTCGRPCGEAHHRPVSWNDFSEGVRVPVGPTLEKMHPFLIQERLNQSEHAKPLCQTLGIFLGVTFGVFLGGADHPVSREIVFLLKNCISIGFINTAFLGSFKWMVWIW